MLDEPERCCESRERERGMTGRSKSGQGCGPGVHESWIKT